MKARRKILSVLFRGPWQIGMLAWGATVSAQTCPGNVGDPVAGDERFSVSEPVSGEFVVSDNGSGLVWARCSEGLSGSACSSGNALTLSWQQALAHAEASEYAGHDDWRLPNSKELQSLVETACYSPATNGNAFPVTPAVHFWTSTTRAASPTNAWFVNFHDGDLAAAAKTALKALRLVRAGAADSAFAVEAPPLERAVEALTPDADAASLAAAFDAAGRYLVFQSQAGNLDGSPADGSFQIFRLDTQCSVGDVNCERLQRVSVDDDEVDITGDAIEPSVSADGQLVVFVAADATVSKVRDERVRRRHGKAGGFGIFLRNMLTGRTDWVGTANSSGQGSQPQLVPGGTALVFTGDKPGSFGLDTAVFRIPLMRNGNDAVPQIPADQAEACVSCTLLSSEGMPTGEPAPGSSRNAVLTADGQQIAFETEAPTLIAGGDPPCPSASTVVALRHMLTGTIRYPSKPNSQGSCGNAGSGSKAPSIDYSGQRLVFESDQPLLPDSGDGVMNVYTVDLRRDTQTLLSRPSAGVAANGASRQARISGNGEVVVFASAASNLDASDGNGASDIVVAWLRNGERRRLASTAAGAEADGPSFRPSLNYVGTRMVFDSESGNLAGGAVAGRSGVFKRINPLTADIVFGSGFE